MSQIDTTRERTEGEPKGIGGWLMLPVLSVCLWPFVELVALWTDLSTLGGLAHLQLQRSVFLVIETAINLFLYVAVPVYLMTQVFQKKARFPRLYQLLAAANLGWAMLHPVLALLFRQDAQLFDGETIRTIGPAAVYAAIWIPYMSMSVRVRNTFVN